MSLLIILTIMLFTGLVGGIVSCILPANIDSNGNRIRNWLHCIILGVGATILVPLFLEIAQSKLMDNIHASWQWQQKDCDCSSQINGISDANKTGTNNSQVATKTDSVNKIDTTTYNSKTPVIIAEKNCCVSFKNYLLFAAYCFLAAAAGIRFISSLMDSVLKDKQIADLKTKNKNTEKEKEVVEKENIKLDAHNKLRMDNDEKIALSVLSSDSYAMESLTSQSIKSKIGPIIDANDPQKGRFGGKSENNYRRLMASVTRAELAGYFEVNLRVEITDNSHPLISDVIFFVHDSFSPSVFTIPKARFENGKALADPIIAYGAFTVGAMTDNGNTMLELDLSEVNNFPKEFRDR